MKFRLKQEKPPKDSLKEMMPLKKALTWILLSVIAVSGSSYAGVLYYRDLRDKQRQDPSFNIVAIAQTVSEPMRLHTSCLAELLDLSVDQPKNFFRFNVKEAEEKLNQAPVIKQAHVKKIQPGIVHVDYVLRKPIALLADYTNTAIDAEGVSFPLKPFFTPKKLPEIVLGNAENAEGPGWGKPLVGRKIELALSLLDWLGKNYAHPLVNVSTIDVAKAFSLSCGERQIVIVLEELIEEKKVNSGRLRSQSRILRLSTENYQKQLENYLVLQERLWEMSVTDSELFDVEKLAKATIIDLRLSNLAFITQASESGS